MQQGARSVLGVGSRSCGVVLLDRYVRDITVESFTTELDLAVDVSVRDIADGKPKL